MAVRDVSNREETLACENDPHIIRLRERGVKQGEGRKSTLSGRHRIVHNQDDTGTISIHTFRWLLERAEERIWQCPDCCDTTSDNSSSKIISLMKISRKKFVTDDNIDYKKTQ
jgi:ribosomal protein L37AE/L43A